MNLNEIGRLPTPLDNCAIAIHQLQAGTMIHAGGEEYAISHTLLEGHRFAVQLICAGESLTSWGMPFGRALRAIAPGEYVCNERVLDELRGRMLDFDLPAEPNFSDDIAGYRFDSDRFQPAPGLPGRSDPRTFMGITRPGNRGVGTRNTIVLLGVNALVAGFVRQLETKVRSIAKHFDNVDDIVAVAHTEGSRSGNQNQELLLRTLAGYLVHPNVAAVLVLDAGDVGVTNDLLRDYAGKNSYHLADVPHHFMSLRGPFAEDLEKAASIVENWLPEVNEMRRTAQPLGELKIALQCGGSDAFSGISGNPLAALVGKYVIQSGGSALLAETDELIGAESYVLEKVRDVATAQRFLEVVERFQERIENHGFSAQGNPSGGNRFRGLYNIYLKSLGAAAKRHPEVRLDYVIDYGERMRAPGYYFMDSPGNDLESIAGQVASGCNLIFFVTGNGSITNFPFVPTIKIVTTSERFALLPAEMDVNAGAYLDGAPLADLADDMLDLSLAIASGQHSAGEKAGHAQVQIWRNWQQVSQAGLNIIKKRPLPDGKPLALKPPIQSFETTFLAWQSDDRIASDRIGLILPSSLCSGQIAAMAAQRLNESRTGEEKRISRFVSLVHTEGCGSPTLPEFVDPLLGYLEHPSVVTSLFLEHGCEITHNDFWRHRLRNEGLNPEKVGWASVQLDGGIEQVLARIEAWFSADCARMPTPLAVTAGLGHVRLGIMSQGIVDEETTTALGILSQQIVAKGGTVILPANDLLMENKAFLSIMHDDVSFSATIAYAQQPALAGLHLMANPTSQWSETMTGLGASGVDMILAVVTTRSQQSHPFIPVLQVASQTVGSQPFHEDVDVLLSGIPRQRLERLLPAMSSVLSRTTRPKLSHGSNTSFQITRGELGVSF